MTNFAVLETLFDFSHPFFAISKTLVLSLNTQTRYKYLHKCPYRYNSLPLTMVSADRSMIYVEGSSYHILVKVMGWQPFWILPSAHKESLYLVDTAGY